MRLIQVRADERVDLAEADMNRQLTLAGERAIEMRTSYANTVKNLQAEYMLKLWRRSIGLWSLLHCACAMHTWSLRFHAYKYGLSVEEFGEANLESQSVITAMKREHGESVRHLQDRMEKIQLEHEVAMDHMKQRLEDTRKANKITVGKHMDALHEVEERLEKAKTANVIKVEEITAQHDKVVELLEEKQATTLQEHIQKIENMDKETDLLMARTKAKHDQQIALMEQKFETLKVDHEEEVTRMEEQAEKYSLLQKNKLQDAKATAAKTIEELTETNKLAAQTHREMVAALKADHKDAVEVLTKEMGILRRLADSGGST